MIGRTGSGSGAGRNHDRHRGRRLGLIHHVEDVERLTAERVGWRRSGVDRRQLGLIGPWFGMGRHLAIAIGPPPAPATTTAPASTMFVLGGLGMFRNAFDMHLNRLGFVENRRNRLLG